METLARWADLVGTGAFPLLVEELLKQHYDPLYRRSQQNNYRDLTAARSYAADDLGPAGIAALAHDILATSV
jgi:tRNA 2-selenouridine synthase